MLYVLLSVSYVAYIVSVCLIIGEADLNHSVKVVSTRFLPCKVNIFLFLIYRYLGEIICNNANI